MRGRTAIVTGGASGIGAALAAELARRGVEVVVADRQSALAEDVADHIVERGGRATAVELDVRRFDAFERLVCATKERTGSVDYLFNNAGIGVGGEARLYSVDDWDEVFDVNLRGVAYGIQAAYPLMLKQGSGHIVNTASMAGLVPAPGTISYTGTKHAVVAVSRALRIEAKPHGVRVSVLCPGVIRTPLLGAGRRNMPWLTPDKSREIWERMRPMPADEFARQALDAVEQNRAIIIVPRWWKLFWYVDRLSPALGEAVASHFHARTRRELAALESEYAQRRLRSEPPRSERAAERGNNA